MSSQKNVLIVDDEDIIIALFKAVLKREVAELSVLVAYNGKEGLEAMFREEIALLVLNLRMPIMDGYEVLAVMAKDSELRKIPVLISTATPYCRSLFMGSTDPFAGMYVEWLEMPCDTKRLVKRIRGMLMES